MQDDGTAANFHSRADEVRKIAQGVFDNSERQTLLQFVADFEKLAAENAHPRQVQ